MNDYCLGTKWGKSTKEKSFRCIGGGFAAWVNHDWIPGDNPMSALHVCPCRKMTVESYRRDWVGKYIGDTGNQTPYTEIVSMYAKKSRSFYVEKGRYNVNSTIISISGMTPVKKLRVTHFKDTSDILGNRWVNGKFPVEINGLWIALDVDLLQPSEDVTEHLRELIISAEYKRSEIILIGKEPWVDFTKKHNLGLIKFHNIKLGEHQYEIK